MQEPKDPRMSGRIAMIALLVIAALTVNERRPMQEPKDPRMSGRIAMIW